MSKFTVFLPLTIAITLFTGCSDGEIQENNHLKSLDKEQVQEFMENRDTGFLYIKSAFKSRSEEESVYINEIKHAAVDEKIDFYLFDASLYHKDHWEFGVSQYSRTLAFYKNGEMKDVLDFTDIEEDDVSIEVEDFIQQVKHNYSD